MSFADKLYDTVKSLAKIIVGSRPTHGLRKRAEGSRIIIMANGPSLAKTIAENPDALRSAPSMAVNFAALAPEFADLRPRYYILADPHFFRTDTADENLAKLRSRIASADWTMTLLVPAKYRKTAAKLYGRSDIATFNAVGCEGFRMFCHAAFRTGLAMPRPRNVLIPALMTAISMGYTDITVYGADHSWMKTISVTDENEVVSIQPHFYADSTTETTRISHEYRNYRLHQIVESFAVAFRAYHHIADYAASRNIRIVNATPGSFIDAFPREG